VSLSRESLAPKHLGKLSRIFYRHFFIGQIIGPVVGEKIADQEGMLSAGMTLSFVRLLRAHLSASSNGKVTRNSIMYRQAFFPNTAKKISNIFEMTSVAQ
jgi:hypothetical protein